MTRDYSKTVIYKIQSKNLDITECYIGSSVNFKHRKSQHKNNCTNQNRLAYNYKVYKFIREHGGFDNWNMTILENYPCNNQREAYQRECYYIECNNAKLNSHRNISSDARVLYCANNANKIREYQKLYQQKYRVDKS